MKEKVCYTISSFMNFNKTHIQNLAQFSENCLHFGTCEKSLQLLIAIQKI